MAASFGEQLRLAREARNVSLREISEQTRISMRYLEAIEADDYQRLPGGIFNKSFIKAYAKYIHFDEKEALEGYARTVREQGGASPDEVASTPYQPRVYTDADSTRSPLVNAFLTILILAILSLGVYAGLHLYQRRVAQRDGSSNIAANPAYTSTNAPAVNTNAAQNNANTQNAPATPPAANFNVQVKARGEDVWIKTRVDDAAASDITLRAGQGREFTPSESLSIECYNKPKANALDISINNQHASIPANVSKSGRVEMLITKANYGQFVQQQH